MKSAIRTCLVAAAVICGASATSRAQPSATADWRWSGDLRVAYATGWRDLRSGGERDSDSLGARFRTRLRGKLNDNWHFQTRFATTFRDEGNDPDFYIRSGRETPTAVEPGTATLDEFFLRYRSDDGRGEMRLGRFQSTLRLPLITNKGLDRNQATNINIGWTDGIELSRMVTDEWKASLTAQYNGPDGNAIVTRGPLDFSDPGSRVSAFAALSSDAEIGPIFLRALTLTHYPDALAVDGVQARPREDYTTVTAKIAAGWDVGHAIGAAGTRLVVAGGVGHAFNRPRDAVLGLPGDGDVDGFAWHLGADLVEVIPDHAVGVIIGQADAGWLLSNDYRQNDSLAEFRWVWSTTESLDLEFRARWRYEQEIREGALFRQRDRDMRLRATWKF